MTELVDLYSKGVKKRLKNYWAAWPCWTRYNLGDVGVLNGHVFEKVATLAELGIPFAIHEGTDSSPLDISSESDVTVAFKVAGQTNPAFASIGDAEAGVKVSFGKTGAFLVEAPEIFESEIVERLILQKKILAAFREGKWEKEWLVVSRLVRAPSATVLISKSSDASLEVAATGNLSAVATVLGNAGAGMSVRSQRGDTINMLCGENVTPVFQLSRLKTDFFGTPSFSIKSVGPMDPSLNDLTPTRIDDNTLLLDSIVFDTITDDELLDS